MSRRALMRLGLLAGAPALPYGYGATLGRGRVVVEHSDCPLPASAAGLDGLRIAVMADFHFDETRDRELVARAVSLCNAEQPDLVMMPGDFVSRDASATRELAVQLRKLEAPLGCYASLGNHDHWSGAPEIEAALAEGGVELLRNRARVRAYQGHSLAVVGLDSAWAGRPDLPGATADIDSSIPRLVSLHEPDYFDELAATSGPRPILQVSGHTHGGQVCAPFIGPLILPTWGKRYPAGPYGEVGGRLYVTRGVGTIGPPARLFCRPEVSLITLRA